VLAALAALSAALRALRLAGESDGNGLRVYARAGGSTSRPGRAPVRGGFAKALFLANVRTMSRF